MNEDKKKKQWIIYQREQLLEEEESADAAGSRESRKESSHERAADEETMGTAGRKEAPERNSGERKRPERRKRGLRKGSRVFLHFLQHVLLAAAAAALVVVGLGSRVSVEGRQGRQHYTISPGKQEEQYEDSELFNQILGNSVSDIICYGAIRGQLETEGRFDPKKEVDVTAFAGRYEGVGSEYITARYYLEDLIKWAQNGFEYEERFLTGQEADQFLSRCRTVTYVDFDKGYQGGTMSYLNSDLDSYTRVVDVSGNVADDGGEIRDDVNAVIMNNRYRTVDGKKIEDHVSSWEEYYGLCANVKKAAEDLLINYEEYLTYQDYYEAGNTNLVYYIRRTIGDDTTVFSNQRIRSESLSSLEEELKKRCGRYLIYDPGHMEYETNTLIEEATLRYIVNGFEYSYPEDTQILIGVDTDFPAEDAFWQGKLGFEQYSPYFWQYLAAAAVCLLGYFFLLILLTMKEGRARRKDTGEAVIRLYGEDGVPTEVMLLLAAAAAALGIGLLDFLESRAGDLLLYSGSFSVFAAVLAFAGSMIFSFFYYSFIRRIKAGTLWKNSLLRKLFDKVKEGMLYLYDNGTVVLRVWIPYGMFVIVNAVLFLICGRHLGKSGSALLLFLVILLADGAVGWFLYLSAKAREDILKGIQRINEGDMEHKIEESALHGDNLVLAQAVNSIGSGIRNAVATSMKDERLKADLITNVSHDIKTPLTSIINYVDLIKRQNVDNPKVREYIEILDSKSQRLKQLTDDLVEASKISSGNIVLQWEKINLVELVNQTIGEFSEKFEQKSLTPVFRAGKSSIFIEADSRRIWRVIENLFHNICKYAMEGTRVYLDIEEWESTKEQKQVTLSIRNISANPLKVDTKELTERFIRGDESRTTEGSGLGLSIAKNLTEAQKGKFEILVDGDLFKVVLTFPLLEDV